MQFKILFVATTLAMSASSAYAVTGKFWCNATKGSSADCVLPGVGPTYACGEAQGASGYQSSSSRKYWTNLPSWGKPRGEESKLRMIGEARLLASFVASNTSSLIEPEHDELLRLTVPNSNIHYS
ncbi:unnamed protein product [Cyclocybe aegerita]|uniref:Uncharacterized protein n=1 Tax=Cyclocybe aegerita TaxID=1973307 RepID=A0A8S0WQX8_CYCAE|nr:unnamed protein product [Cyclocybe aegerita]